MNRLLYLFSALVLALSACSSTPVPAGSQPASPAPQTANPQPISTLPVESSPGTGEADQGLVYQSADGNRLVEGRGNILAQEPLRVEAGGEISWVVGVPYQNGALWTAVLADGSILSYLVEEGRMERLESGRRSLPQGMPPLVTASDGAIDFILPASPEISPLTHPTSVDPERGRVVFIALNGDLVLWEGGKAISRLEANALPDARLIRDDAGRLLFLSDPTERYDHGVLGDGWEAASISLVETSPILKLVKRIEIPAPAVIEGIAPIWVDLDGDGEREILVTVSDTTQGARLVLFSEEGDILAESPAAGQGYRWRHQLAAAPLGEDGQMLIVDVLRPHLDAVLEFFLWEGDQLVLTAELAGYSSHRIGSRNLDMGLVGDMDGDGALEVVVPGPGQESLHGIGVDDGRAMIKWSLPLAGRLSSNLAAATLADGSLSLGAGVGEVLLVWE